MQYSKFSFQLTASNDSAELGFETWINDQRVFATNHVRGTTVVSGYLPSDAADSTHTLKLVLKGKNQQHTRIDTQGKIITDDTVNISGLEFDGIALNYIVNKLCVYHHDFNGTGAATKDRFYGTMGCNGTVELPFTTPIYLWMLENM
jgi:hypothetical protein